MKRLRISRLRLAFLLVLAGLLCPAVQIAQQASPDATPSANASDAGGTQRAGYVGDATCQSCHKDQALSYLHTGHHLTSQLANRDSILGSFRAGANVLMIADPANATADPGLYFKMEERETGYYQTAVIGWPGELITRSERFDVVIGSGMRGKSYLYWHGERLFELPVSYWVDGQQWINSPGFKDGKADFTRAIYPRCLECHATYIRPLSADPLTNRYDRASLVTGISCETCHGPGANHVAVHRANPANTAGLVNQAILNPAKFSRDRQVDLCALCHNGIRQEEIAPAFTYKPGEPLDGYLQPNAGDLVAHPDVHGNQVGLLERSRCYLSSPAMNCSTCHDVHAAEKPAASYSSRCLTCHRVESCGMSKTMGKKIAENCIDCHMPVEQTSMIASETAGRLIRPAMRSHWIKIYPSGASEEGNVVRH